VNDLPSPPDPHRQGVDRLRQLRDVFSDAAIAAARDGDVAIANWARTIADRYAYEINERAQSARTLRNWVFERRLARPCGSARGDITGIPPWSQTSLPASADTQKG
jgi:hypothetical protein